MEYSRSKSCRDGRMEMDGYYGYGGKGALPPRGLQDLRSYSVNYAASAQVPNQLGKEVVKIKKGKSGVSSKSWTFNNPELQRKKRVASYKVYAVEGKVKGSLRKSFGWIKEICSQLVYGGR